MRHRPVCLYCALLLSLLCMSVYAVPGDFDTAFGGGRGWVSSPIVMRPANDYFQSVVRQVDGKLVAAGWSENGSNYDFSLVRYNTDGSLDETFSGDGKLTTAIGSSDDKAYSIIQQLDGKLVVAGYSAIGGNTYFALVRYCADGSLDYAFNGTGKLVTAIGPNSDIAYSVIQQSDGKLVVAGQSYNGTNYDIAVARYNIDGTPDASFNGT